MSDVTKYAVVIERGKHNLSAYVPDLPGVIATGRTKTQLLKRLETAVRWHVEAMREDGDPIPKPTTDVALVRVA